MGGGWETSDYKDTTGGIRITIYPSEIHEYAYCPRQYFFKKYLKAEPGLTTRLRLLLGRLFHLVNGVMDRIRGMRVEETREAIIGDVRLRGRPDSYKIEDDVIRLIERKSGRKPRRGAWISDVMQATAYTLILSQTANARSAVLEIHYRDGVRIVKLNEDLISGLLKAIDEVAMVKQYGIVPKALRSERKCSKCPFREECTALDEDLGDTAIYEPGEWLEKQRVIG
ncbi:MAG: CRISPR-associated protein Cas4 [Desulfurococcales archaeon]|nr:CRISPR-associated protein Cas4 [Desulfurococcales archaeon]